MDTTMELDDFKAAWKSLDAQLARNAAINLHLARETSFDRTRASLRPLTMRPGRNGCA